MRDTGKVYVGHRIQPELGTAGGCRVTVNGRPLRHVVVHSPDGFNWGYGGSGPADLAYAILADYLGDEKLAAELHQAFKWDVVARLDQRADWTITGEDVDRWLRDKGL